MATKINLCQYVIIIKPQNFDTADIKYFTEIVLKFEQIDFTAVKS